MDRIKIHFFAVLTFLFDDIFLNSFLNLLKFLMVRKKIQNIPSYFLADFSTISFTMFFASPSCTIATLPVPTSIPAAVPRSSFVGT